MQGKSEFNGKKIARLAGRMRANSSLDESSDVEIEDGLILTAWENGRDKEKERSPRSLHGNRS